MDKFIFLANFIILDYEVDNDMSIILGEITHRVTRYLGGEEVTQWNYTKRHQDIYVVRREEVPLHPQVATNH